MTVKFTQPEAGKYVWEFDEPEAKGIITIEEGGYGLYISVDDYPGTMALLDLFYRSEEGQGGCDRNPNVSQIILYPPEPSDSDDPWAVIVLDAKQPSIYDESSNELALSTSGDDYQVEGKDG